MSRAFSPLAFMALVRGALPLAGIRPRRWRFFVGTLCIIRGMLYFMGEMLYMSRAFSPPGFVAFVRGASPLAGIGRAVGAISVGRSASSGKCSTS